VILGCVVQVKVGDKVVKTEATRDEYMRKYGSLFGGDEGDKQAKN